MMLSASRMRRWMACPLQQKLSEEFDVVERQHAKTSFGTIIHAALELYNTPGSTLEQAIEFFLYCWDNPTVLELPDVDSWTFGRGTNYGGLRLRGVEILEQYDGKQKWNKRIVVATEHPFVVPFGEHFLRGFVDLIEIRIGVSGTPLVAIVDYKSTSKKPTVNDLNFDIQMTTYLYASMQKEFWVGNPEFGTAGLDNGASMYYDYLKYPRRAFWYHLWGNQELDAGSRDDGDFMRMYRCAEAIALAVERDVYVPNISASSCMFCDYVDHCEVMIPVRSKLNQESVEKEEGYF
jgi:hypothetical protein